MTNEQDKQNEGIIAIGASTLLLFLLVEYMTDASAIIGAILTAFAMGIAFTNRYLKKWVNKND